MKKENIVNFLKEMIELGALTLYEGNSLYCLDLDLDKGDETDLKIVNKIKEFLKSENINIENEKDKNYKHNKGE